MAGEFQGDVYDFGDMTDDEVRNIVVEHLRDQSNLDADDIDVQVRNGAVTLTGRVGSDAEVEIAGEILDDVLGLDVINNELVVDELRRGAVPADGDAALSAAERGEDQLGGSDLQQSDTAEHLVEDLASETLGTHDMGRAIRDATAYSPPDEPVGDGYGSREDH